MSIIEAHFNGEIDGYVTFIPMFNHVRIYFNLESKKYKNSTHGCHIHTNRVNTNKKHCCDTLGGHYNPTNEIHGRHIGDIIHNISFDNDGNCIGYYDDYRLYNYLVDIVGRSLVIHSGRDDCGDFNRYPKGSEEYRQSKITGNAGKIIACANITKY